ncbi:MAG TPA: protein kinase [Gemmataceae bacterium]|nr:protein kinase [Gemmataceae bacterium]
MTERDIFIAALQLDDPDARRACLAEACGPDAALRARVEELLAAHDRAASFLEAPPAGPTVTADLPPAEGPGTTFGPYKLLEQIGEGGFGVVFLAEQTEPVRRKVALKVLKPGMDTRQVVARFEAERQALAIMDHPNIARVFDGGATPSGRPYFVMELVKGVPITEFCDQHHLTPRQRLELFISVCQAVQHAHQKGVIHRDLKPSNVLVSRHDAIPVVKVIDFGVAKALGQSLTDKTLFTGLAQMIGTPLYMSPEQAGMSDLDVDTRSDIYSLGVLLYELLTGTTPFTRERFRTAAYDEIQRIIREEEPPKPSTRLSESTESLPSISAQRQTEPAKLSKLVRGELDWIVMKALEKDRSRRYETANGFAMDVQRYLAGEAVQAVPPSAAYRLKKFVRRNKGPVLAVSVVLLALVAGIVGTAWQSLRTERARQAEAERAEGERRAKERAEAHLALANEAVEKYLGTVTLAPELGRVDLNRLRRQLLLAALPFFERLAAEKGDDPAFAASRGLAYLRLAHLRNKLGEHEATIENAEAGRAIFARLAAEFPAVPKYRRELAVSLEHLGGSWQQLGKREEAEAAFRQAVAVTEQLSADFPDNPQYRLELANNLTAHGFTLEDQGERGQATAAHRRAREIRQELVDQFPNEPTYLHALAQSHNNIGTLFRDEQRYEEQAAAYGRAIDIQDKLAARFPDEPVYHIDLAKQVANLGGALLRSNKLEPAEAAHRRALGLWEKLAGQFPTVPLFRQAVGRSHNHLAFVLQRRGNSPAAEVAHARSIDIRTKLAADFPTVPDYLQEVAYSHHNLGELMAQLNKAGPAEAAYREAVAAQEKFVARFRDEPASRQYLAQLLTEFGNLLKNLRKFDEAGPTLRRALSIREKLAAEFPGRSEYVVELGGSYCNLGVLVRDTGDPKAALGLFDKAVERLGPLLAGKRPPAVARLFLRNSHWGRAAALDMLDRHADATHDWEHVLKLSDGTEKAFFRAQVALSRLRGAQKAKDSAGCLSAADDLESLKPTDAGGLYDAACIRAVCAAVIPEDSKIPAANAAGLAKEQADKAMALLHQAVKAGYKNAAHMKKDKDLDALSGREDFKKLVADLEANKK